MQPVPQFHVAKVLALDRAVAAANERMTIIWYMPKMPHRLVDSPDQHHCCYKSRASRM